MRPFPKVFAVFLPGSRATRNSSRKNQSDPRTQPSRALLAPPTNDRRAARFDAPVGLDGKRGDGTTADDANGGDNDAANRRAAALAALAGGTGTGGGGGGGGGSKLTWAATWAPAGGRGERGGGGEAGERLMAAPEAPKKRMSAK